MKKTIVILAIVSLILLFCPAIGAESPSYSENWDGRGSDSLRCELSDDNLRPEAGWIHWVFSTKGASTSAQLTLGGTGAGTYNPDLPLKANVWHFYTPYFDLNGLTAIINLYGGNQGPGGGLVISDYCPGKSDPDPYPDPKDPDPDPDPKDPDPDPDPKGPDPDDPDPDPDPCPDTDPDPDPDPDSDPDPELPPTGGVPVGIIGSALLMAGLALKRKI